ncbi:hypothetical protein [Halorarius litoreus]|uniref:hypothetical protein n=1 Tax=Halorarius litoreus TaxID=2962676 RepID=UPI0020CDF77C|nr:hypothetical protein [Halorarius litoreus]
MHSTHDSSGEAESPRRPVWSYPLLACLLFLGLGALYGGASLVLDPTGGLLGIPYAWIRGSVFGSFLLPGLVLLVVLGGGSVVVTYGVVTRRLWAWPGGIALGLATVVWIAVQFLVLRHYFFLQPIIVAVGAVILGLLWLPSMRAYYRADAALDRLFGHRG